MKSKIMIVLLIFISACCPLTPHKADTNKMPDSFIDIQKVIPDILLDIRYYGHNNFLGEKVDGYLAPKCYLTKEAAQALAEVQKELAPFFSFFESLRLLPTAKSS